MTTALSNIKIIPNANIIGEVDCLPKFAAAIPPALFTLSNEAISQFPVDDIAVRTVSRSATKLSTVLDAKSLFASMLLVRLGSSLLGDGMNLPLYRIDDAIVNLYDLASDRNGGTCPSRSRVKTPICWDRDAVGRCYHGGGSSVRDQVNFRQLRPMVPVKMHRFAAPEANVPMPNSTFVQHRSLILVTGARFRDDRKSLLINVTKPNL